MSCYDSIGVLGGGSWGTTIAHILGANGHNVLLWLRNSEKRDEINNEHKNSRYTHDYMLSHRIQATCDIEEVVRRCEILVVVIPSSGFREVSYQLGNYVKGDQILISATKGLEQSTYARMTTILREETCAKKIGVLSGPNLFQEILNQSPSGITIGSKYNEVINRTKKLLTNSYFRVYGNKDIHGVELGGVIKNVIAIAAGIADGLGYGDNTKAMIITRGIVEMGKIGCKLGSQSSTFTGMSGIGDTITTCAGQLSRNYRVGYFIAKGEKLSALRQKLGVTEGVNTAKVLHEFSNKHKIHAPIIHGVYQVLYENADINRVVDTLMTHPFDSE